MSDLTPALGHKLRKRNLGAGIGGGNHRGWPHPEEEEMQSPSVEVRQASPNFKFLIALSYLQVGGWDLWGKYGFIGLGI